MFIDTHSTDVVIHALAIRLGKQCRSIVQACLREEEWRDCDLEYYRIIRAGLEEFAASKHCNKTEPFRLTPTQQEL
jgi:hypothetical protein